MTQELMANPGFPPSWTAGPSIDLYERVASNSLILNIDHAVSNAVEFRALLPEVECNYAVKAMLVPELIHALSPYVQGFDVASLGEAISLIDLGISPQRISFNNPVKVSEHVASAYALGVDRFAAQSIGEIEKIGRAAPGSRVLIRIRVPDGKSLVPLSGRFGCEPAEVTTLLQSAQDAGLVPEGVTFHVGSQTTATESWETAIAIAHAALRDAHLAGIPAMHMNMGGGFNTRYFSEDPGLSQSSRVIKSLLQTGYTYASEPGRFIVASAATLVTDVIAIEWRDGVKWVATTTSRYHAFTGADRYAKFPYTPKSLRQLAEPCETLSATLTGPTCDSADVIAHAVELDAQISVGDRLVFPNMGAYTTVYGAPFNGFPMPVMRLVSDGSLQ